VDFTDTTMATGMATADSGLDFIRASTLGHTLMVKNIAIGFEYDMFIMGAFTGGGSIAVIKGSRSGIAAD